MQKGKSLKRKAGMVIAACALLMTGSMCFAGEEGEIDYLVLVNKEHSLPEGWEEQIDITEMENSRENVVEIESTAYEAFLELQAGLADEGVLIDLDNAYRSCPDRNSGKKFQESEPK